MITYRQATHADIDAMTRVEADSWPPALAASRDAIASRVTLFPTGQWVATRHDQVIGAAFAQRIDPPLPVASNLTYELLTDCGSFLNTHIRHGSWYQLVGVGVIRSGHGLGIGRGLIDRQIEFARSLKGIKRILGFTRPARFSKSSELSIEDYVAMQTESGHVADPVLSFHLDSGASLVSCHAGFRPNDHQARGYGILIEYPVDDLNGRR